MTEKTAIDLLYEAATFCGFKPADGWPAELNPRQLAALMAGGFKEPHKQAWRVSLQMIADAIKSGSLATRIEQPPDKYVDRWIQHPRAGSWATGWGGIADGAWDNPRHRGMIQTTDKVTPSPIHHISRVACRDWHRAISKPPSEYVRAWLGLVWQEEAPKVGAGDTAPIERRTRAALIKDLQAEWHTIERDLQDASRNGLAAAKLADKRGWDKGRALEWAREHGKLTTKEAATWFAPPAILPTKPKQRRK
jgi:hypothetical protein